MRQMGFQHESLRYLSGISAIWNDCAALSRVDYVVHAAALETGAGLRI
jgi:hypothetical protein